MLFAAVWSGNAVFQRLAERQQFFYPRDDALLFGEGREGNSELRYIGFFDIIYVGALREFSNMSPVKIARKNNSEITRKRK